MSNLIDFQPYLLPHTDPWALKAYQLESLLNYLREKDINRIFCLPPVKEENTQNNAEFLKWVFKDFQNNSFETIEYRLAARYRLDNGFIQKLYGKDLLIIGENLIVDVSPLTENPDTWKILESIIKVGYTPIIFQPERTTYWSDKDFDRLKTMGCDLLLNMYSLFGYHGDNALMYSRKLLEAGMYTYVCSGMEDTKVMRYSENFSIEQDKEIEKAVLELQENNRRLWFETY